jgi:hypothetical protein
MPGAQSSAKQLSFRAKRATVRNGFWETAALERKNPKFEGEPHESQEGKLDSKGDLNLTQNAMA